MKIAVLSNVIKSNPTEAAKAFLEVVGDECEIYIANELRHIIPAKRYYTDEELFKRVDTCVVFGGDGTTLTAARRAAPFDIPVLSINTGHLGFLATVSAQDAKKAAKCLLEGSLKLSERMMLEVKVFRDSKEIFSSVALNDIVVNRSSGKMVSLSVLCNGSFAADYRSDGVVISTPTGSTAYSLSCGGPIVLPELELFIITPVCPHFLGSRPMILPSESKIEVTFSSNCDNAYLIADGQDKCSVCFGDEIVISRANHKAKLLTLKEQNFFNLVRKKLTII